MSSGFSWTELLKKAWATQEAIEDRVRRQIRRWGPGFIVGLFGFSLIALGVLGLIYYIFYDRGLLFLIIGQYENVPMVLNPLFILVFGFMIILMLLLIAASEKNQ